MKKVTGLAMTNLSVPLIWYYLRKAVRGRDYLLFKSSFILANVMWASYKLLTLRAKWKYAVLGDPKSRVTEAGKGIKPQTQQLSLQKMESMVGPNPDYFKIDQDY